jgi:hypothetical protein
MFCYCRSQLLHTADSHNTDVNSREALKKMAQVLHNIQTVATKQVMCQQKCGDTSPLISLCGYTKLGRLKTLQWAVETKPT